MDLTDVDIMELQLQGDEGNRGGRRSPSPTPRWGNRIFFRACFIAVVLVTLTGLWNSIIIIIILQQPLELTKMMMAKSVDDAIGWAQEREVIPEFTQEAANSTQPPAVTEENQEVSAQRPRPLVVLGANQKPPKYVLDFVHIPKTGGTSIEAAYADAVGGSWGFCKFENSTMSFLHSKGAIRCPSPDRPLWLPSQMMKQIGGRGVWEKLHQGTSPWHLPPHRWNTVAIRSNNRLQRLHIYPHNTPLFCVVRNPYDRLVSEYYFVHVGYVLPGTKEITPTAQHLNQWAQTILRERRIYTSSRNKDPWSWYPKYSYGDRWGHWIPQYDFVYDTRGRKIVEHVLKFENLTSEFDELMARYNLTNIKLPKVMTSSSTKGNDPAMSNMTGVPSDHVSKTPKLTREDLDPKTIAMIHVVFARDFEAFGYDRYPIVADWTNAELWNPAPTTR